MAVFIGQHCLTQLPLRQVWAARVLLAHFAIPRADVTCPRPSAFSRRLMTDTPPTACGQLAVRGLDLLRPTVCDRSSLLRSACSVGPNQTLGYLPASPVNFPFLERTSLRTLCCMTPGKVVRICEKPLCSVSTLHLVGRGQASLQTTSCLLADRRPPPPQRWKLQEEMVL